MSSKSNTPDWEMLRRSRCVLIFFRQASLFTLFYQRAHVIPIVCVCVFSSHSFWTLSSLNVPAGVTHEEGHTGFFIHLPSVVRTLIFVVRRIKDSAIPFPREVEFCVLMI